MKFEFNNFVGLVSMAGTVAGMVLAGATMEYSVFVAIPFIVLAIVSFIIFVAFLYHYIKYAEYYIPVDNLPEDEESEKKP
jgi:ABC-type iron transport system FetAB permease component